MQASRQSERFIKNISVFFLFFSKDLSFLMKFRVPPQMPFVQRGRLHCKHQPAILLYAVRPMPVRAWWAEQKRKTAEMTVFP